LLAPPHVHWAPGSLSPGVDQSFPVDKATGYEKRNHLPSSVAEIKNTWSYISFRYTAWFLIKYKDKFFIVYILFCAIIGVINVAFNTIYV
jgi:hypothetical protein